MKLSATCLLSLLLAAGPVQGGWTILSRRAGMMNSARSRHAAAPLADGRVLVAGGLSWRLLPLPKAGVANDAEIYDPWEDRWTALPEPMSAPRWDHVAAALPDGRVLIAGGKATYEQNSGRASKATELFDPATGAFVAGPNMATPRAEFTSTLASDGRVLLAGGMSAEAFDCRTGRFGPLIRLRMRRSAHAAVAAGGPRVLLVGGEGEAAGGSVEMVDIDAAVSQALAAKLSPPVNDLAAVAIPCGDVVVLAGQGADQQTTTVCQLVRLTGGLRNAAFAEALPTVLPARHGASDMACHAFGPLALLAGGEAQVSDSDTIIQSAWLFDTRCLAVVAAADLLYPHDDLAAAELPPNALGWEQLLLIGGLASDRDFGEMPQSGCEILTLAPNDCFGSPRILCTSGVGNIRPQP